MADLQADTAGTASETQIAKLNGADAGDEVFFADGEAPLVLNDSEPHVTDGTHVRMARRNRYDYAIEYDPETRRVAIERMDTGDADREQLAVGCVSVFCG